MKRHIIILLITFLYLPEYLEAQLKYYDATEFPLYGKATKNTENRDKHPRTPIIFIEDPRIRSCSVRQENSYRNKQKE